MFENEPCVCIIFFTNCKFLKCSSTLTADWLCKAMGLLAIGCLLSVSQSTRGCLDVLRSGDLVTEEDVASDFDDSEWSV